MINALDPGRLMSDVDRMSTEAAEMADRLADATRHAANSEQAYEREYERQVISIYHEAKRSGERMPAEDVRRAVAHEQVDDAIYATHLLAKAEVAALEKKARLLSTALSGKQSLLRAMTGGGG